LTIRNTAWTLGLSAAAVLLAITAPALAAPSGDEYLPKVPKAAGKELAAGQDGAGGSILEPEVRGAGNGDSGSSGNGNSGSSGKGDSGSSGKGDSGSSGKGDSADGDPPASSGVASPASSSDDDSGASALLDPVVLLVIAGVIAATAGMTLRRRQTALDRPAASGDDAPRKPTSERPTPDGGIDGDESDES
jgi:hypothetical protein